jgi:hypothetical protein
MSAEADADGGLTRGAAEMHWAEMPATGPAARVLSLCLDDNLALLRQGARFLEGLGVGDYDRKEERCFASSMGGHYRHVLEHYEAFLAGWSGGRIDYEARPRDLAVETDLRVAQERTTRLAHRLASLRPETLPDSLLVRSESAGAQAAEVWAPSSPLRELEFLLSHSVHHYALVAVIARLQDRPVEADFGMAPSTLRHRQRLVACAR